MLIPIKWLNDYVKCDDIETEVLKNKLFSCGFEVEDIIEKNKDVCKIVCCKILQKERHPEADKLFVCKVDAGAFGELQIVTNATNVSVNDIVPVALDGAILADGTKIKRGKLRGVASDGMFCGGEEIGITEEYYEGAGNDSVLIFHDDFKPGQDVSELLDIKDTIFDISVTANRPDCQSVYGIAREVAAVLNRKIKPLELDYTVTDTKIDSNVKVTVKDGELCSRYMAGYVYDVNIEPSPKWMQRRLALMGLRAINNVVDITNYILNELGQPMHAFDYRELTGKEIVVRRAVDGEKITTLDKKENTLSTDNLVICDADKPSALAGIMGGLNSGIKDDTSAIVFESARFKRDNIRRTSRILGVRSDSSSRYEKGVDAYTPGIAIRRALHLISKLNAGKIADGIIDKCFVSLDKKVIKCTFSQINKLLGIVVPVEETVLILKGLDFETEVSGDNLTVKVPLYREDVEGFPDLAEEIIRMYGYDHIDCKVLENSSVTFGGLTVNQKKENMIKQFLTSEGFCECITYSFISPKDYENFGYDISALNLIRLKNPLGEDQSIMRTTLIPSITATASRNFNRKNLSARLFELAKVYIPKELPLTELPCENLTLSLAIYGDDEDFFTMKGVVEEIVTKLRVAGEISYERSDKNFLHPTRSANMKIGEETVAYFGQIHPSVAKKTEACANLYVAEIDFEKLLSLSSKPIYFEGYSKFPTVERDLALLCDETVTNKQIIEIINSAKIKALKSIDLFDVYKGEKVSEGKMSLAYRLVFSMPDRTLELEEVDGFINKILKKLAEQNINLR